jgi:hypothetical protein
VLEGKLKERRGGLKSDVQEAEIAAAAKNAKNKPLAMISYLLKIGFTEKTDLDFQAIASAASAASGGFELILIDN